MEGEEGEQRQRNQRQLADTGLGGVYHFERSVGWSAGRSAGPLRGTEAAGRPPHRVSALQVKRGNGSSFGEEVARGSQLCDTEAAARSHGSQLSTGDLPEELGPTTTDTHTHTHTVESGPTLESTR